jgi:hypothetical protein
MLSFLHISKESRQSSGNVSEATENAIEETSEDLLTDVNNESQSLFSNVTDSPQPSTSTAEMAPVTSAKKVK